MIRKWITIHLPLLTIQLNLLPAGSWCFNAPLLTEMYLLIAEARSQPVKKIGWRGGKKTECSIMSRQSIELLNSLDFGWTKPCIASAGGRQRGEERGLSQSWSHKVKTQPLRELLYVNEKFSGALFPISNWSCLFLFTFLSDSRQ